MCLRYPLLALLVARAAVAQTSLGGAEGVVRDGISRMPLAGAQVQLVAAGKAESFGRTVTADSLGRYLVDSVPAGRYTIGYFHPVLDSLGVEGALSEITVSAGRTTRVDLATPTVERLRAVICQSMSPQDSGGLLVGFVRDAMNRRPLAAVSVTADWLELVIRRGEISRHVPHVIATTGANGWFAVCNVPSGGTMHLRAARGMDSTELIDLPVPREGFVRRDLYLGAARVRMSGTVVSAADGRPLGGAQVAIAAGSRTVANERGEWTLVDAPSGTRMFEVRAVGYYPERRAIDVVGAAPRFPVALATMKSVLDTVRVTAARLNRGMAGFEERRRSGVGHYLTAADIERRQLKVTSDVFKMLPGFKQNVDDILMRSGVSSLGAGGEWCHPTVFVDGHLLQNLGPDDLNDFAQPEEIAGMEVYTGATAPAQFQVEMSGCGSIVIWRKVPKSRR